MNRFLVKYGVALLLLVLALALGLDGFIRYFQSTGQGFTFLDALYATLQLFALNVSLESRHISASLEAARFLAPAAAAYSIVLVAVSLGRRTWSLTFARQHVVICGMGNLGRILASYHAGRGDLVVALEKYPNEELTIFCESLPAILLAMDATQAHALKKAGLAAARQVYITCGSDMRNLEVLTTVADALGAESVQSRRPACAVCFRQLPVKKAQILLDPLSNVDMEIHIFNDYKLLTFDMLHRYPLDQIRKGKLGQPLHVMLSCVNDFTLELALTIASTAHFADGLHPHITFFRSTVQDRQYFHINYPFICGEHTSDAKIPPHAVAAAVVNFRPEHWNDPCSQNFIQEMMHDQDQDVVLMLCDNDEEVVLSDALSLVDVPLPDCSVLARMNENGVGKTVARLLREAGLTLFHLDVEILSWRSGLVDMARQIHNVYLAGLVRPDPARPGHQPWAQLPYSYRLSNFLQAAHVDIKLRTVGCTLVPGETPEQEATLSGKEIETLARMEHERWLAERCVAGWAYGPERDEAHRLHPGMVPYSLLPEADKEYNRNTVAQLPVYARGLRKKMIRMV